MDHLHILHLARREDRMQMLIRQMEWNKVSYTIWEGIDNPDDVMGSICLGHKKIIQYAKDNNLPSINIAEDDINFTHKDSYKYFLENTPEDYDMYCGMFYQAEVDHENRIKNGMSGVLTLFKVHSRFYDFILNLPNNNHLDRELGSTAFKHKYYVSPKTCCYQSNNYSDNFRKEMNYDLYMEGKDLFKGFTS